MSKCYHPEGVCEKCPHPELCPDEKNTLHKETLHKVEQFSCPFFDITCKTPMCDICVHIKKNNEEVGFSAH
ncbi:MAG: hypothetical protein PHE29_11220 [Tissierellia bacterium]|nr:hypothetical protein [Tissierellia bacterium]